MEGSRPVLHGPKEIDHQALHEFQTALLELLLGGSEPQETLNEICRRIEQTVPNSYCSIMIRDPELDQMFVRSAPSVPTAIVCRLDGLVPGPMAGSCGTALFTGEMQIVADTADDPRWSSMRALAREAGIKACWSVPVDPQGDSPIASFAISRTVTGIPGPAFEALLQAAGHITGLALLQADARRRDEAQRDILAAAVEDAHDCIWSKDTTGVYQYVNASEARSLGLRKIDVLGHTDEALYAPEVAALGRRTDEQVIESGKPTDFRLEMDGADGAHHIYHVRKHPRFDEDGNVSEVIGIARDITNEENSRRALEQSQKMESLGLLAGGIAHDFNNLLVGILGNADWLLSQQQEHGPLRAALHDIRNAAERAGALTNQMLAYAGRGRLVREQIELPALVRDVLNLVKGSLPGGGRVRVSIEDPLPETAGDPTQLRQVFMNLLVNAGEAVRETGGAIEITCHPCHATDANPIPTLQGDLAAGHYLEVCVRDEGIGMTQDTIDRIFDPFFTTKTNGRGLGLAATVGILTAHGGRIQVTSSSGDGSTFRVFLPVHQPACDGEQGRRGTILVVDDESLVRNVAERILRGAGYAIRTASDGIEAVRMVREPLDLTAVLLDHNLPGQNGLVVLAEIRAMRPDLPVLMLTGGGANADLQTSGAPLLPKPFTAPQLLEATMSMLSDHAESTSTEV